MSLPACQLPTGNSPVHEPERQLVDRVALDCVDELGRWQPGHLQASVQASSTMSERNEPAQPA